MFRLISLLIVVVILALISLKVLDSTSGGPECTPDRTVSTLAPAITDRLPKSVADDVNC